MVCIRCQKRPAIIFIQRMDNGQMKQEGYCLHCARELHIKPVDDLMKQFGMSDQDLDNMENRMESMMEELGDANPLSMMMNMANGGEDADPDGMDEDLVPGSNATFPLGFTSSEKKDGDKKADRKNGKKPPKRKFLDTYCENLTRKAREGKLDDIIGRDREIYRTIQILSRRQKNNPCLIGEAGVGKTAIAEGIAERIAKGEVPIGLKDKEIYLLDLTSLVAGTQFRGQFEQRVKGLLNEVKAAGNVILFIDEIHRFSKSQQDSLLGAVETGVVTLIGATTENPSFEVIRPLLSRCQLYVLKSLEKEDLLELLHNAIAKDVILKEKKIELKETDAMLRFSGGDARKLLNILELVVEADADAGPVVITDEKVTERLQQNPLAYDKDGEMHYDIISAFIKSIRGSDPDGALYWLARMVEAGEDPAFIARRLVISAAEDIGLANPNALLLANAAFDAVMKIGWPEGRIPLAEATVYLATSPKSNSAYEGINSALELVRQTGNLPVPLHLRNAPTKLMKQLGYGKDYKYAHAYQGNFVQQQFLPDEVKGSRIWHPQNNAQEAKIRERMQSLWGERFKE